MIHGREVREGAYVVVCGMAQTPGEGAYGVIFLIAAIHDVRRVSARADHKDKVMSASSPSL